MEGLGETGGLEGTSIRRKVRCTYKYFVDHKATEFHGNIDPVLAITWLTHIEKMFQTIKCLEGDKVDFGTNVFKDEAHFWREMVCSTLGRKSSMSLELETI